MQDALVGTALADREPHHALVTSSEQRRGDVQQLLFSQSHACLKQQPDTANALYTAALQYAWQGSSSAVRSLGLSEGGRWGRRQHATLQGRPVAVHMVQQHQSGTQHEGCISSSLADEVCTAIR